MRNIRVTALRHLNLAEMTEMWNRCWRGYYYDMTYTPEHMRGWLDLSQASLSHSLAIWVEDQIVGFALLSFEGSIGWIAGACIDPDYRRQGLFTVLMRIELELARRLGLKRVYLEVLEQNQACQVYQSVGFTRLRQLNLYHVQNRLDGHRAKTSSLELISLEKYFSIRRDLFNPAWQRREGYLRRHVNLLALMNSTGSAGALFAGERNTFLLDAWSTTVAGAEEVIATIRLRSKTSWSLTNQPEDLLALYLKSWGIYPSGKQFEMCVELT